MLLRSIFKNKDAVADSKLDEVFNRFLLSCLNINIVQQNKQAILQQACDNLGLAYSGHTDAELNCIARELKEMVYVDGYGLPRLFSEGDELEADLVCVQESKTEDQLDLNIVARNVLRNIFRGTVLNSDPKYLSGLGVALKNIEKEKNPKFFAALRAETHKVLSNVCEQVVGTKEEKEEFSFNITQFKIFLSNLLSIYTFFDPIENEAITIPQDIPGLGWMRVSYRLNKIDISPKTGLLSLLIEDQDRMYAYTLTPQEGSPPTAVSHLLLMGTTFQTGQGSALAALYNYFPRHSVGEAHELSLVSAWIKKEGMTRKIHVSGLSKGATMAMIVAAMHPDIVVQADCLNPTGLCHETLNRLMPLWLKACANSIPIINVYAQAGDPVFPLENGFLPGTNIYRILTDAAQCSAQFSYVPQFLQRIFESHVNNFAGRKNIFIIKVNLDSQNHTLRREFFADVKGGVSWVVFPIKYMHYASALCMRKVRACITRDVEPGFIYSSLDKMNLINGHLSSIAWGVSAGFASGAVSGIKVSVKYCARNAVQFLGAQTKKISAPVVMEVITQVCPKPPFELSYKRMVDKLELRLTPRQQVEDKKTHGERKADFAVSSSPVTPLSLPLNTEKTLPKNELHLHLRG